MDIVSIQEQLETLLNQVDPITEQYHKSKTPYDNLEKQSKSVIALAASNVEGSESQRNREAFASKEYKDHSIAVEAARGEYNRSWALLEGLKLKIDILRSLNKHLS